MELDELDRALIDRWQRDLPLVTTPFATVGRRHGLGEAETIERLAGFVTNGLATRVGAVLAPNTVGASTLAAMAVPQDRLEAVAAIVDAEQGVNHNYERENRFNLWFVVTGADRGAVDAILARIEEATGIAVLDLPMLCAYHIDLGFPIDGGRAIVDKHPTPPCSPDTDVLEADDISLLRAIEDGLPLVARPFQAVAQRLGRTEADVISRLQILSDAGIVRRLGIIVRHRSVGFSSNAMAVWQLDEARIDKIGAAFASHPSVTLCYRRRPAGAEWPYTLFVMVHAKERCAALSVIQELNRANGTESVPQAVLFSRRCFKQRGARLVGGERRVA